jgi:hypothetical protein
VTRVITDWDGADWQKHCDRLCHLRHAPGGYQPIPDRDRGDRGLEGHTTDGTGIGYQFYAPAAGLPIKDRRSRQNSKITKTVTDIIRHCNDLGEIVGRHTISKIYFLFPEHDSRFVNTHLRTQEVRLQAAITADAIIWLDPSVVLAVHTEDDFPLELAELRRVGASSLTLSDVSPSEAEIEAFREELGEALPSAHEKVSRAVPAGRVGATLEFIVTDRVAATTREAELETRDPLSYEDYLKTKRHERARVRRESVEGATAGKSLSELRERTADRIYETVGGLRVSDAERFADGAIAEWLLECSLDFPEPA